ncbi:hypothetical protein [Micromonospora sp. NPDC005806]
MHQCSALAFLRAGLTVTAVDYAPKRSRTCGLPQPRPGQPPG